MAQIVSLLNGENINYDWQKTAIHNAMINPGVITGLQVTSGQVTTGEAFIECIRSNGEKIIAHFANTTPFIIDTIGNGKIFVKISQENIDNGVLNAEDGSNIGRIERASQYPDKNYIPLAKIEGNAIVDDRRFLAHKLSRQKIAQVTNGSKLPKEYIAGQTLYGPESIQASVIGIVGSGADTVNLYTFVNKGPTEYTYMTQMAYSANGANEIWMRKAVDANNWGEWSKVFPFSSESLDIFGLSANMDDVAPIGSDFVFYNPTTQKNQKVGIETLKKWTIPSGTQIISESFSNSLNDYSTKAVAIPRGALVYASVTAEDRARIGIWHSVNNDNFSKIGESNVGTNRGSRHQIIALVPPGFVKIQTFATLSYGGGFIYSIQVF